MEIENAQDGTYNVERGGSRGGGVRSGGSSSPEVGLAPSKSEREMWLTWEDLSVVVPQHRFGHAKKLLSGASGYAEPGRLMAIMGPSGSGKTTFLDALAGRLSRNVVMAGNVLFNGKRKANPGGITCKNGAFFQFLACCLAKLKLDPLIQAYVTQNNVLLGTLTVRETIAYSAELRLPSTMSKEEISRIVDGTIEEMGLQDCADRLIGNWHLRGISGGEKKRLSIALEILTRPTLLFLDEPTSGLDSASAYFVVNTIRNIAHDGRTVLSSIHQPSSEVFALFDDLYLLSSGEAVFFGGTKMAVEFFAEAGFPCPSYRNPSDHFLCCINTDFDNVSSFIRSRRVHDQESLAPPAYLRTEEVRGLLVEKYRISKHALEARVRIKKISKMEDLVVARTKESNATWTRQLSTLTRRSLVNMSRDIGYYWVRIVIYIVVSTCVGTIFFHLGRSHAAVLARGSCGAFIAGFMTFMSIGGFPSFIEEMKVFYHERFNGHYGISVYILSNFLSSFPFLVVMSIVTATITFYMVSPSGMFSRFLYACLDLYCNLAVVESCMMVIASIVPNFLMGVLLGSAYLGIMMMTAGYFRFLPDLPKPFWRYPMSYINYGSWGLQGLYKNDLIGLEFDPLTPNGPKLRGEYVLTNFLGVKLDHSKWWDLAAVVIILLTYRLILYATIRLNERVYAFLHAIRAKRFLQGLIESPAAQKIPSFRRKGMQSLHSLSSQEGLNSPLH